ncbi:MAG: PQQ-binding-like beta-propeller repeat protein [bacterium]|nr:PQQ-binding-like beta-propeller repeat protein [bacterium]
MKLKCKGCLFPILMAAWMALTLPLAATTESDWSTWSGPHHNLSSSGDGVFDRAAVGLELLWTKPLGSGYSGIAIVGERLVTGFSDGESDFLTALDAATGKEFWRYRISDAYLGHDGSDDGPIASPTIHDGVVFTLSPRGRLFAVRLDDGGELWSYSLVEELGASEPFYGFGSTPVVVGGVLVVQSGVADGRSIAGLDRKTGELLWSTEDDAVNYQTPIALRVDGEEQIFAVTSRHLLGLEPRTGKVIWKHQHSAEGRGAFRNTQPLPIDEGTVLLSDTPHSTLVRVKKAAGGFEAETVWQSRALRGSLSTPVPHGRYLYGYAGRSILTCVDAGSGETVWKSRQPGGGTLVLVDGHLVILAPSGEVVVAEATPEGYREKARVEALDRGYYTRPSFAGGRIFVRNLSRLASVGATDRAPVVAAAEAPEVELLGEFGEFVRKVKAAEEEKRPLLIDEFMASHPELPLVEGEDLVHFVYRGEVEDLALAGDMVMPTSKELPMHRVAGTDFYFRSMKLPPAARFEYHFSEFGERRTDPHNPRQAGEGRSASAVLTTRGWQDPAHLREPEGPRGRIEKLSWRSEILDNERELQVYLPPGYDQNDDRYPLLFVHANEALTQGQMANSLDNLVGKSVAPLVVAFVPPNHFSEYGSRAPEYAAAFAKELIPLVESSYRTLARPEDRGVMGTMNGARFSIYVAFKQPGLFGKVAAQSLFLGGERRREKYFAILEAAEKRALDLYVEWSLYDLKDPVRDGRADNLRLVAMLEEKGYQPVANEVADGAGWGGWRQRTDLILETLFPLE